MRHAISSQLLKFKLGVQAWYKTLKDKCKTSDGKQGLVLDVGANFGYYTFYAAQHGCRQVFLAEDNASSRSACVALCLSRGSISQPRSLFSSDCKKLGARSHCPACRVPYKTSLWHPTLREDEKIGSCRVVAWEPVPIFRAFLEYGLQVNNMTESVRIRDHVVGEKAGVEYELTVPQQGIWGTASVNGRNIDEYDTSGCFQTRCCGLSAV